MGAIQSEKGKGVSENKQRRKGGINRHNYYNLVFITDGYNRENSNEFKYFHTLMSDVQFIPDSDEIEGISCLNHE